MLSTFVINLDRSPERLDVFAQRCSEIEIPFERFPAILGADLPNSLKPYFCDASGNVVSPLKPAEIGCYASHLGVWQRIVERRLPAAVVCEDDSVLPNGFDRISSDILSRLPPDWDMVLLANTPSHAFRRLWPLPDGSAVVRYSKIPGGTGCYLISLSGAAKMLHPVAPRVWAADHDTRWPWRFGVDTYGVYPPPVGLCGAPSTINPNARKGSRSGRRRGVRWSHFRTPQSFLFNIRKLGPYWWVRCVATNIGVKLRKIFVPVTRPLSRLAKRTAAPHPERG